VACALVPINSLMCFFGLARNMGFAVANGPERLMDRAEARAVLRQQAAFIRHFPEVRFSVYGHTDLVGSRAYNHRLGLRRARAAVDYLVSLGVERSRLEALVSLGETQPIVATESEERRNRRTVTEVTGFVRNNPLVLDGRYAQIVYRSYAGSSGGAAE